jgi:Threonine synthase
MAHADFPAYRGRMEYVCLDCGARHPGDSLLYTCPQCGGVFLLENLDFDKLKERSGAEWRELFDARSASRSTALRGIFRFYELLAPLLDEDDIVYLGEGITPIIEAAPALRDRVGVPFAYKNDGQNPQRVLQGSRHGLRVQLPQVAVPPQQVGRSADRVRLHWRHLGGGGPLCLIRGRAPQERGASAPRQGDAPAAFPASGQRSNRA